MGSSLGELFPSAEKSDKRDFHATSSFARQCALRLLLAVGSLLAFVCDLHIRSLKLPFSLGPSLLVYLLLSVALVIPAFAGDSQRHSVTQAGMVMDTVMLGLLLLTLPNEFSPMAAVFFVFNIDGAARRKGSAWVLGLTGGGITILILRLVMSTLTYHPAWEAFSPRLDFQDFAYACSFALISSGVMIFLAKHDQQENLGTAWVRKLNPRFTPETSLRSCLDAVMGALLDLFAARQILAVVRENPSGRGYLWSKLHSGLAPSALQLRELGAEEFGSYFLSAAPQAWCLRQEKSAAKPDQYRLLALNKKGASELASVWCRPAGFLPGVELETLMAVSFSFDRDLVGSLYLVNPTLTAGGHDPAFYMNVVRDSMASVYSHYRIRRLRARARKAERSRLARQLHDRLIQSLISTEMEIDVLSRMPSSNPEDVRNGLGHIRDLLDEEVANAREMMHDLKQAEVCPADLPVYLAEMVRRLEFESGMKTQFLMHDPAPALPAAACAQVARIVREGLVNVRKHSHAHNVSVSLELVEDRWILCIQDDGCGFSFEGRRSLRQLDSQGLGPAVIKECVRALEGNLVLDSESGLGSRMQIEFPAGVFTDSMPGKNLNQVCEAF